MLYKFKESSLFFETTSMREAQTHSELWGHLTEQIGFLRRSCADFDDGYLEEAKRMALTVRTLLVNGPSGKDRSSRGLLWQLRLLPKMGFIDSVPRLPKGYTFPVGDAGLLTVQISVKEDGKGTVKFMPRCQSPEDAPFPKERIALFQDWWSAPVIITRQVEVSRRELVRFLANEYGGAHVDPKINKEMADLIRKNPFQIEYRINEGEVVSPSGVELYSMRQIAHEVIRSIERKLQVG